MKNSKELFAAHIRPLQDAGMRYEDIAKALGIDSPAFIGMIAGKRSDALLPMDRLPQLAKLCCLTAAEVMVFALARVRDAKKGTLCMNTETFKFLLKTFARMALSRHGIMLLARGI